MIIHWTKIFFSVCFNGIKSSIYSIMQYYTYFILSVRMNIYYLTLSISSKSLVYICIVSLICLFATTIVGNYRFLPFLKKANRVSLTINIFPEPFLLNNALKIKHRNALCCSHNSLSYIKPTECRLPLPGPWFYLLMQWILVIGLGFKGVNRRCWESRWSPLR